jgi:flagellar basal-body rod modification protein FlgD
MSVSGVNSHSNPVQTNDNQGASNTSADSSLQSIESTFLTLLVQELQNQDPTAPMDSTQMVGQMISLNQLDQLASIDQVVTNALGSSSASAAAGTSGD